LRNHPRKFKVSGVVEKKRQKHEKSADAHHLPTPLTPLSGGTVFEYPLPLFACVPLFACKVAIAVYALRVCEVPKAFEKLRSRKILT